MNFLQRLFAALDLINRFLPLVLLAAAQGQVSLDPIKFTNWAGYDVEIRGAQDASGKVVLLARKN